MNIHDEMSDNEVLRGAADSLSAMPVASPPDVEAIMARGRARRTRRLSAVAGLSVAGAAAGTALALGLTGVLGPARPPGTIRTASFTLASNANGTATLTINPKELLDPAALQSDFAQDGIPAKVTSGSLCTSDPAPAGFSQVVSVNWPSNASPSGVQPTITIDPSAMPAGTELSVGDFQLSSGPAAGQQQADFVLIDTSSNTCSSTPPDPNGLPAGYGPDDGIGLLYGGPGPAGS
jgi:anti-sigma factor RsiW